MGDEGVGWHVINRLACDPRLPEDTELIWCGTDLLACADPKSKGGAGSLSSTPCSTLLKSAAWQFLETGMGSGVWRIDSGMSTIFP